MNLPTEPYLEQAKRWPSEGRHILAHYDDRSIIVYQAYRPSIGRFTIDHGYFGGGFSFPRMSWIKPKAITGLGLVRHVHFYGSPTDARLMALLRLLKEHNEEFTFYDRLYPSGSDPGAYFSYSPFDTDPGIWRMTFGNHGWSGGIYEIDEQTICCQLRDLISKNLLETIKLDEVHFFAHYQVETAAKSKAMNEKLLAIHGQG